MVKVMNNQKKKKGQSTLEYIILVTGVIAILIVFLNPNGGVFNRAFNSALREGTNGMENMAQRLSGSRPN
ncbi:MAG: class III signal peptide-containing protein [Candidatus Omnitrophica bacterium]|nr:class III signal peptide-containing protein [Candidatus Omnitrophota bacterium]